MATPDLTSLFGQDPQLLQQAMDIQAAKLTPEERLYTMGAQTGRSIGQGLGSLFGVEVQDPLVQKATALRSLAKEFDTTTPDGLMQFAQAASKIDPRAGALAAQQAQAMMKTQSEIAKNLRERAAADPIQQLIRTGKYTPASVAAYAKSGNIEDLDNVDKADPTTLSETKEGIFLVNKQTGAKIARIGDAPERGTKVNVAPEIKMAPDIVGAVSAVDKATEKEVAMMDSAALAKQLINQTAASNNSQTWEAARTTVAKAVGENKLSNEDIRRTGVDPRLVQGALDWVNKKIEGVPNQDIQKQLFVLGSVLENNAKARYDAKVSRYRGAAQAANFPGQPSTYFPTAAERSQQAQPNVVDWSSLKK